HVTAGLKMPATRGATEGGAGEPRVTILANVRASALTSTRRLGGGGAAATGGGGGGRGSMRGGEAYGAGPGAPAGRGPGGVGARGVEGGGRDDRIRRQPGIALAPASAAVGRLEDAIVEAPRVQRRRRLRIEHQGEDRDTAAGLVRQPGSDIDPGRTAARRLE